MTGITTPTLHSSFDNRRIDVTETSHILSHTPRVLVRAETHICTLPAFTPNCCRAVKTRASAVRRRRGVSSLQLWADGGTALLVGGVGNAVPLSPPALLLSLHLHSSLLYWPTLPYIYVYTRVVIAYLNLPYSAMHAGECTFLLPGNVRTQRVEMKCVENVMKLRSITGTSWCIGSNHYEPFMPICAFRFLVPRPNY